MTLTLLCLTHYERKMKHTFIIHSSVLAYSNYLSVQLKAMRQVFAYCLMVLCLGTAVMAHAGPPLSYDQIRAAREKGEVRSLRWVMHQIQPQYPGRLLDAELSRKSGRYLYRIKLLQPGGYVSRLVVDAYTAEILKARSRPLEKRKH